MLDWLRERIGGSEGVDYTVDYAETRAAFESFVRGEGVTTDGDTEELIERFEGILSRYDEISAEVESATNEITEDGEVTLWDTVGNEQLPEWQEENPTLVAELESLNEEFDQLIEELNPDESAIDEGGPITEVNAFYRKLNNAGWLTE
ncbi:hypothetical protein [Halobellus marinus]|uniref:hypothetical protein n=1 Tax=Halobellus TaxID=1073986 RepID=UPI0028B00672|nr:hypothetical protein [Halobellus sp. DFY28]